MTHPALQPADEYNEKLRDFVHPANWTNPTPAGRYNLVVIGAGTAGLVTAAGAAGLGARVALIERDLMGGDCLNVGCVPSKALISAARSIAAARAADQFGIRIEGTVSADFPEVMRRLRRLRSEIAPNDSASRFANLGVDVYLGRGRFTAPDCVEVGGQTLRFARAVIATGGRAATPPIPGLAEAGYLTNETVFSLTELPQRLAVIGGGPIGCELAQAFARLGSQVIVIERSGQLLGREDEDAAACIHDSLCRDGVQVLLETSVSSVKSGKGTRTVVVKRPGSSTESQDIEVDQILVAAGRTPNIADLNLDVAGVKFNEKGVIVDDHLRTTNTKVYAAGDVCSPYKFTHAADFMARIVIQNSLFYGRARASRLTIPWCTYTSPEVAHVGLNEITARDKQIAIRTFVQPLSHVDRAQLESSTEGFVKIHVKAGSDQIVGATIVADHAGEMIGEIVLAMTNRIGLGRIASTVHPYPTVAEAVRKCGDQYNKTRLTPFVKGLFQRWLKWTR